jgi:hypothetical protein
MFLTFISVITEISHRTGWLSKAIRLLRGFRVDFGARLNDIPAAASAYRARNEVLPEAAEHSMAKSARFRSRRRRARKMLKDQLCTLS